MGLEILLFPLILVNSIHPEYLDQVRIENRKFEIIVGEHGKIKYGLQAKEPWGRDKYVGGFISYTWEKK